MEPVSTDSAEAGTFRWETSGSSIAPAWWFVRISTEGLTGGGRSGYFTRFFKPLSASKSDCRSHGWLDSLAISLSVLCAFHCLLTPILVVFLPILATTFWVHHDFHLWMILFVVPTTSIAIFMGCRRHKDKAVFLLSGIGLILLVAVAFYEVFHHSGTTVEDHVHCAHCVARSEGFALSGSNWVNVVGGIFLASAHVRNYLLCRRSACSHEH
ncbi:MAG: MerC domain-containing protein [Puniceicoccales bacterium]